MAQPKVIMCSMNSLVFHEEISPKSKPIITISTFSLLVQLLMVVTLQRKPLCILTSLSVFHNKRQLQKSDIKLVTKITHT